MPRNWERNPPARTTPYTKTELLDMYQAGDPVSTIMARAKRVNGWNRGQVREVIFGKNF
jgi:hypothetical protein